MWDQIRVLSDDEEIIRNSFSVSSVLEIGKNGPVSNCARAITEK